MPICAVPKSMQEKQLYHVLRMYHGLKKQLVAMCNDLESEIHVRPHFNWIVYST